MESTVDSYEKKKNYIYIIYMIQNTYVIIIPPIGYEIIAQSS